MTIATAATVRIEVCGQLKVVVNDEPCETDIRPQARVLLAFLALNRGRTLGRGDLLRAVWGEDAAPARGACLSSLLSRARRLLGEGAIVGEGRTSLHLAAQVGVDFHDARRWLSDAQAALATSSADAALEAANRAIAVADRGVLVGDTCSWLEAWRRDLVELGTRARECAVLAALLPGGSGLAAAVERARELVAAEPYLESAHALLMRALAAQGNVAHALTVYEQLRTRLTEELGLAPGPQLRELHGRLLREDAPSAASALVLVSSPVGLPRCDGVFVGRADELHVLSDALEAATRAGSRVVLVEGEAGIGKTRLTMQFTRDCERRGVLALYGRCDAESLVPYQPLVEGLRRHLAAAPRDGLRERITADLPVLGRVLPELGDVPDDDADSERHQIVDAFCAVLRELSRSRPLVLVLDDLHWADAPTLLLLRQLVRCTSGAPVLLVASYRPAERGEALEAALADLQREHLLPRIALRGLGSDDARALIGQALPHRLFWERSRGNPFFLKELVRHGASGGGIPHAIRDVIGARLARLSPELRAVLEVACAAGSQFSIGVLEQLCGLSEDALDDALREAVDAQVIAEQPGVYGRFEFEHNLTRQTIYEGLTRTRRGRLHMRVAETLERLGGADAAELAHHFQHAPPKHGLVKALDYTERAARHALAVLAFEDAVRHYERAVSISERLGSPGARRHELLLALGGAQGRAGDLHGARRSFGEAAELARALGCPIGLARAVLGCGVAGQLTGGVIDRQLVGHLEEALRTLGDADAVLRSRLLARLAIELSFAHDRERLSALSSEAVALARRTSDADALSWALIAFHWSLWEPENVDDRLASASELLTVAASADNRAIKLQGHRWRLMDLLELGYISRVDAEIEAYAALAHERRQPADLWYLHLFHAMRSLFAGDYERADAESQAALELGRRIGDANAHQGFVVQQLMIARDRGGLAGVEDGVRANIDRYAAIPGWRCALALLLCELGRIDEARAEFDLLAADRFEAIPRDGLWLGALCCLAEVACTLGDTDSAAVLYASLRPFSTRTVTLGFAAACCGPVSRPLALLAAALDRRDEAVRYFDAALAASERMGARPTVARIRLEYGRFLLSGPQPTRAHALVRRALLDARELNMPSVAEQAHALSG